jgi:hypothetical protein
MIIWALPGMSKFLGIFRCRAYPRHPSGPRPSNRSIRHFPAKNKSKHNGKIKIETEVKHHARIRFKINRQWGIFMWSRLMISASYCGQVLKREKINVTTVNSISGLLLSDLRALTYQDYRIIIFRSVIFNVIGIDLPTMITYSGLFQLLVIWWEALQPGYPIGMRRKLGPEPELLAPRQTHGWSPRRPTAWSPSSTRTTCPRSI